MLAQSTWATCAFSSCPTTRSSVPVVRTEFPLEISSSAFFPGIFWSPSSFSFPRPNNSLVGVKRSKFMFVFISIRSFAIIDTATAPAGSIAAAKLRQKPRGGIAVGLKKTCSGAHPPAGHPLATTRPAAVGPPLRTQARSAAGDTPYWRLNADEKCDGFLNPTSA